MVQIKQNPDNSELSNMAEVEVVTVGNCEPIQIVVTIGYWVTPVQKIVTDRYCDPVQIAVTVGYCDPPTDSCYIWYCDPNQI